MTFPRARVIAVVVVLAASVVASSMVLGRGFKLRDAKPSARLFDQVLGVVSQRFVDSLDAGTLYRRAAAGLVAELGDPHGVFLDSSRLARVQSSVTGLVGSLGLEVDTRDGWLNVLTSLPNTPAEQVGLRTGDRIVAIDGRSTRTWTAEESRRALRGTPGTSVKLTVVRLGTAGQTELVLERESVYVRPVQRALMVSPAVGYISLRTFSDSAALEVSAAVDSLYKLGMRKLVFDLRGNPGGLLAQGTGVADLFLNPGQPIVTLRGRTQESQRSFVDERPQQWKDLKLAVLVNRGTASAAEIVAGALQDHDRAIVIGRATYGKGSAQSIISFHDQAGVRLTIARWYTPAGRNIEVTPANTAATAQRGDTTRPVFKTDSGRTVFGGGGIVPDVIAGDSVNAPRVALYAAVGSQMRTYAKILSAEAKVIAARGVVDPMFTVTPDMRNQFYAALQRAGVTVVRPTFDAAAEWLDQQIGVEVVREALGRDAAARRQVLNDKVVELAVLRLGRE